MPVPHIPLALYSPPPCADERAGELARSLGIPLIDDPAAAHLVLQWTRDRLELRKPGDPELPGTLRVDFASPDARRRALHPGRELVVQAAKVRNTVQPLLIDTTAGLGRDGFLLAAAGFEVWMFERHPIVAALLADGLKRAAGVVQLAAAAARIQLIAADALERLPFLARPPEVIYLDPMFPPRSKTAKVKQELRLLQLLDPNIDAPERLLQAALALRPNKVVVKRPRTGPFLLAAPPSYSLHGKAVRFDVYVGPGKNGTTA